MSDECFVLVPDGEGGWATACFSGEFRYERDWELTEDHVIPRSQPVGACGGHRRMVNRVRIRPVRCPEHDDPANLHVSHAGCQRRQGAAIRVLASNSPEWNGARSKVGTITGPRMRDEGRGVHGMTPEAQATAQYKGRHVRWHENRGITKPGCALCAA